MPRKSHRQDIVKFILKEVEAHPRDIVALGVKKFNVTPMTMNRYLKRLISERIINATGLTKAREYKLNNFCDELLEFIVTPKMQEEVIWRQHLLHYFESVKNNIINLFQYGISEMLNNVLEHSDTKKFTVQITRNARKINIKITDFGIGIFEKIRLSSDLEDARHALLELSKGKFTTDPNNHSGEGIFFTSRMFDKFSILSNGLFYSRTLQDDDEWLIEVLDKSEKAIGTTITFEINTDATHTAAEIFKKYQDDDFSFARTHVPVRLARYANEQLVSRSQAKRILARFDKFSEVILDFQDVAEIGQAFADEIFRVFKNKYPNIKIIITNTTPEIIQMIKHVEPKNTWESSADYSIKIKNADYGVQEPFIRWG